MEEVIKYLCNSVGLQGTHIRPINTLVFTFADFEISIVYEITNKSRNIEFDEVNDLLEEISALSFLQFFISISEPFSEREDYGGWNSEENKFSYPQHNNSIYNSLLKLITELSKINRKIVLKHKVEIGDPDDSGMCGYYPKYIGEIEIDLSQMEFEIFQKIISALKSFEFVKLDNLYVPAYYNYKRPKNNFSAQFLNTNTKVRRLGYLKLFFSFITEKKKIPQSFINKKFEEFSLNFSSQLNELTNKKGIIQNSNGKSAEPYVTLLREMDLITVVNRVVVPTKWLKTYLTLREIFPHESSEVFVLDKIDKIFILEVILKKDFLYSIIILEFLFIREACTTNEIISSFQKLLLNRIENLLSQAAYKDEKGIPKLREIEKRVSGWKKAEVYLEHIIMPRINWFADLDLVALSDNIITINENGKRLLIELNSWVDIQGEYVADSTDFLKKFYPHIYAKSYFGSYGEYPEKEIIHGLLDEYINESFPLFKTLAPNRVTSSQVFTFAKYCLFLKNKFSVSESYLSRTVEENFSNKYIYKFQPRYGDGYIQKI